MRASDIHAALGDAGWVEVLERLGIAPEHLRARHGPCPLCGGRDRYRFTGRGRGRWICNQCGHGDGFALLAGLHGWSFAESRRRVIDAAGLQGTRSPDTPVLAGRPGRPDTATARPTGRVARLLQTSAPVDAVPDAVDYLASRSLWPLPAGTTLRAHAGVEYYGGAGDDGRPICIGRYAALVAPVHDVNGELVTAHVTYLAAGRKLNLGGHPARKLLGPRTGRRGCAVRITPASGETLGIAEGIETALAAARMHNGLPVWAALSAGQMREFEPPTGVWRVVIYADRDVAGLEAAIALAEQLDGRASVETRTPPAPANDWADVLAERSR